MTAGVVTIQRVFRCHTCGRLDVYHVLAEPVHCGRPMDGERDLFRGGDPLQIRIDVVEYVRGSVDDFQVSSAIFTPPPEWAHPAEIWCLKPGRLQGERIGWIGETILGWKAQVVPGVRSLGGAVLYLTREDAIAAVWYSIQ